MNILIEFITNIVTGIFSFLGDALEEVVSQGSGKSSQASFGKRSDILRYGEEGFVIDGKVQQRTTLDVARRNALVYGNSGSGKSECFVKPLLLSLQCSAIVNNGGGNLTDAIAYQQSQGIIPLILDLSNGGPVELNVLDGCKDNPQEIRRIVRGVMGSVGEMKRDFFTIAGEDTLFIFICFVLESVEIEAPSLADVYDLMVKYQGNPEKIAERFAYEASENTFNAFLGKVHKLSDNTRKSVLATSITGLSWLGESPVLRAVSSHSSFQWEDFRNTPHCLYIDFNAADAELLAPMIGLIFQSFYRFAFSQLPPRDGSVLDIMVIMDEFHTILKSGLPDFAGYLAVSRKYHIPTLLLGQSPAQLSSFGELKKSIEANCFLKCYFGGMAPEIAKELEAICGEVEETDTKGRITTKPLFSAYNIRQMKDSILVVPSSGKPLRLKMYPAYKQPKLQRKLAMSIEPQYALTSPQNIIDETV